MQGNDVPSFCLRFSLGVQLAWQSGSSRFLRQDGVAGLCLLGRFEDVIQLAEVGHQTGLRNRTEAAHRRNFVCTNRQSLVVTSARPC